MLHLALVLLATLGPEVQLSTPAIEPAPFANQLPSVASNGREFLVVWEGFGIHAARVDDRGAVRDDMPLAVVPFGGSSPSVASDGRDYVVAYSSSSIRLARVDAGTGEVTAGGIIDGATAGTIASNGSGYLVAYKRGTKLEAVAVDADAAIVGGPFSLGFTESRPRIASNGSAYLIVSQLTRSDLTATLFSNGAVVRTETVTVATRSPPAFSGWSVASDGDGFLVAWAANGAEDDVVPVLRVRGYAADGAPAGPPQTIVRQGWEPAVNWNGSQYFVTYTDRLAGLPRGYERGDVRGIAVSVAGAAGAPTELTTRAGREQESAAATNGVETLVAWTCRNGPQSLIEVRLLDRPTRVISIALAWQQSIAAAPHRSGTIAVWSEIAGEEQQERVMLQRLDARGVPRDGRGIRVHESERDQQTPAVAGSLVVWVEQDPAGSSSVWAKMLDASGAPYGEAFQLGIDGHTPAIAAAGNAHLVVWNARHCQGIVAVRADPFAQTISEPFFISRDPGDDGVAVASDGSAFLVTWFRDWRDRGSCGDWNLLRSIHAVAVTRWGVVAGPPVEIAERTSVDLPPIPLWNGSGYVVFWNAGNRTETYGRAVRRNGLPASAARIVTANARLRGVAWNGEEYRMVIRRAKNELLHLDRDFRILEQATIDSAMHEWSNAVVLVNGFLMYRSPEAEGGSRALARRLP
jgi:hypothetical protein